jgi:hypothetical protein
MQQADRAAATGPQATSTASKLNTSTRKARTSKLNTSTRIARTAATEALAAASAP